MPRGKKLTKKQKVEAARRRVEKQFSERNAARKKKSLFSNAAKGSY